MTTFIQSHTFLYFYTEFDYVSIKVPNKYIVGSVLEWFSQNCYNAGWMLKIDDDTVFNPFVFKEVFQPNFVEASSKIPLVIGFAFEGNPVTGYI